MNVQKISSAYQTPRTVHSSEKKTSKKAERSTSAKVKVCAGAAIGLITLAAIYVMTGQKSSIPAPAHPIVKCVPGNVTCEVAKTFFSNPQGDLKITLGSVDDHIRKTVYESCTALFSAYNIGDPDEKYHNRKIFFNTEPVWSFLLMQDSRTLRTQLEEMCESFQPSPCESDIPESIDNMFAYLLNRRWNDPSVPMEGSDYDLFSFCNAQIGKENFYEAASSVAKVKIGSTDFYDRKIALVLFRSLFKDGQGYKAADEAIEAHKGSTDPHVRESILALSRIRPGRFSGLFG